MLVPSYFKDKLNLFAQPLACGMVEWPWKQKQMWCWKEDANVRKEIAGGISGSIFVSSHLFDREFGHKINAAAKLWRYIASCVKSTMLSVIPLPFVLSVLKQKNTII